MSETQFRQGNFVVQILDFGDFSASGSPTVHMGYTVDTQGSFGVQTVEIGTSESKSETRVGNVSKILK